MKPVISIIALLLGACVAEGTIQEVPPSGNFSAAVPVRLVPFDPNRADPLEEDGWDYFIRTGPFWTRVFSSSESIEETFTIRNARMEDNGSRGKELYTYFVEGELICGGNVYPIKAQGSRSARMRVEKAKADAIQRALLSVVKSVEKHLEHCKATATPDIQEPDDVDLYDELVKLKQLLDEGILTQAEFDEQKKKLLDRN